MVEILIYIYGGFIMTNLTGNENKEFTVLTDEEMNELKRELTEAKDKKTKVVGITALISGMLIGIVTTVLMTVLVKKSTNNCT